MQVVATFGQMNDVLSMQGIVGQCAAYRLSDSQTICIAEEGSSSAGLGHLLELGSLTP